MDVDDTPPGAASTRTARVSSVVARGPPGASSPHISSPGVTSLGVSSAAPARASKKATRTVGSVADLAPRLVRPSPVDEETLRLAGLARRLHGAARAAVYTFVVVCAYALAVGHFGRLVLENELVASIGFPLLVIAAAAVHVTRHDPAVSTAVALAALCYACGVAGSMVCMRMKIAARRLEK
jgi:hypothetical protein